MEPSVRFVQTTIGHVFHNQDLWKEALTTAGVASRDSATQSHVDGNASLALIGDGIIRVAVSKQSRAKHHTKGEASLLMQNTTSNAHLAEVFQQADLTPHVIVNPSQQGLISTKTAATVVAALVGAVYEDADMATALLFTISLGILIPA